jgi:uncharacterized protein DUF4252
MRQMIIAVLLAMPAAAWAQSGRINIDIPQSLAAKAVESVDVNLDGPMLRLASKFLITDDVRDVRDVVRKLDGVYVHSYEFESEGEYDRSIVERIRTQLGPDWKRIVTVKSRTRDNVEIYTRPRGDSIAGLVVISAEPRELTLVNIVGPIDLDKLASLEGQFGIPKVTKHE